MFFVFFGKRKKKQSRRIRILLPKGESLYSFIVVQNFHPAKTNVCSLLATHNLWAMHSFEFEVHFLERAFKIPSRLLLGFLFI